MNGPLVLGIKKKRIGLHFNEVIPTHAYDEHWYGAFGTGICLGGYAASNRCFVLSLLGNVHISAFVRRSHFHKILFLKYRALIRIKILGKKLIGVNAFKSSN